MTAPELISTFRQTTNLDIQAELIKYFCYKPELTTNGRKADSNLGFRTDVVKTLLPDFSLTDIRLIRTLFSEEMKCERETWIHDNLYQLCFYLYSLGQLEDSFILYDAKFNARNMDVACMLDREAITVGHEVEEVINYVEGEFVKHSELKEKYPSIISELYGLLKYPDYESIKDYSKFIKGYFYGHENVE